MDVNLGVSPFSMSSSPFSDGPDLSNITDDDLSDDEVQLLFSIPKPVTIDSSDSSASSPSSSSSSDSSDSEASADIPAAPPRITVLRGINSFDAWETTLRANLEFHGVAGFLEVGSEDDNNKDERRKLAKSIIVSSALVLGNQASPDSPSSSQTTPRTLKRKRDFLAYVEEEAEPSSSSTPSTPTCTKADIAFVSETTRAVYKPLIKRPRYHFDAAVDHIVRLAAASGYTAGLVQRLSTASRAQCESIAAYQRLVSETRRSLQRVRADPGDEYMVWVVLQGLQETHPRWRRQLQRQKASPQGLGWDGLMAAMSARACREQLGGGSGANSSISGSRAARLPEADAI